MRSAVFIALAASMALATPSLAETKSFSGTRDQVRSACAALNGAGRLLEMPGFSLCENTADGSMVGCNNEGNCASDTPDRRGPREGMGTSAPRGGSVTSGSLSGSSDAPPQAVDGPPLP